MIGTGVGVGVKPKGIVIGVEVGVGLRLGDGLGLAEGVDAKDSSGDPKITNVCVIALKTPNASLAVIVILCSPGDKV